MKKKKVNLHRGQILEAAVSSSGLNITKITKKAGYSRSSYYKHIHEKDLQFHVLIAYGNALKHDFTQEFPEMPKYLIDINDDVAPALTLEEASKQINYWKDRYIELLEKFNALILERNK